MKILLDEDVPRKLVRHLPPEHDVQTVVEAGWSGTKNGELLKRVEGSGYDVFITGDKSMGKQQRLSGRCFGVLVLSAVNWVVIQPHVASIAEALTACEAGTIRYVDCGRFIPRKLRSF